MTYSITSDIPDSLLELYLSEQEIAIDSEFHGLRLYRDEVCLIQICDDKKNVSLVKPDTKKVSSQFEATINRSWRDQNFSFRH